jgi:hypothetical protein
MSSGVDLQVCYEVANAPLRLFPYPHLFVQNIFPAEYYAEIQEMLPDSSDMLPIADVRPVKGYDERFVLKLTGPQFESLTPAKRLFWGSLREWLVGGRFGQVVLNKFGQFLDQRFGKEEIGLYDEALLVQDTTNYKLGPHTDAPRKVITLLFYLPKDMSQVHLGTSLYMPKDPNFRCPGGPHYPHEGFEKLKTMPFLPNSLFAFVKTDNSFHGVEPIGDADCKRWLLLYDMYAQQAKPAAASAVTAPKVEFSF